MDMDRIVISHLGLSDKDLLLVRNLLKLNQTWLGNFVLADQPATTDGQILLLDQSRPESLSAWRSLQNRKHFDHVITLVGPGQTPLAGCVVLMRPLVFRRLNQALEQAVRPEKPKDVPVAGPAVLVVDDSLPVRTFMMQKLHDLLSFNLRVDLADGGEEALEKTAAHPYQLAFIDVMMPGLDGYQTCKQLKALSKQTQVVMLTGKSSPLNRMKGKLSGCDAWMTKPPDDAELLRIAHRFLPGRFGEQIVVSPGLAAVPQFG